MTDITSEFAEVGVPMLMALAMMEFAKRQRLTGLFIAFAVGLGWALIMWLTRSWQAAAADGLVMLTALAGTLLLYRRFQPR